MGFKCLFPKLCVLKNDYILIRLAFIRETSLGVIKNCIFKDEITFLFCGFVLVIVKILQNNANKQRNFTPLFLHLILSPFFQLMD